MWTIQGSVMISVIYTGKHSWKTFPIKISSNLLQAVTELQGHLSLLFVFQTLAVWKASLCYVYRWPINISLFHCELSQCLVYKTERTFTIRDHFLASLSFHWLLCKCIDTPSSRLCRLTYGIYIMAQHAQQQFFVSSHKCAWLHGWCACCIGYYSEVKERSWADVVQPIQMLHLLVALV